jgi:4-amino-4-deoxy-L-arabinose transferase-like glycosyltransferase
MSKSRVALLIAALGVVLVVGVRASPLNGAGGQTDYEGYYRPVAASLAHGDGAYLARQPAVRYPIGYPALLAVARIATGSDARAVTLINALSVAVSAGAVYALGRRWFTERVGVVAAVVLCVNPLLLYSAASASTELPFIALFLGGLWMLSATVTWERALGAGALFGVGALVRPAGVMVCLVAAMVLVVLRTRVARALLVVVGSVAVIVPWGVWTSAVDASAPLGTAGPGTVVAGLAFAERDEVEGPVRGVPADVRALGHRSLGIEAGSYREIAGFLADETSQHPGAVAQLLAVKATRAWYGTDSFTHEPITLVLQLSFLSCAVPGLVLLRSNRTAFLWVISMVLYFWVVAVAAVSIVRYMVPAVALLCIPAALAVQWIGVRIGLLTPNTQDGSVVARGVGSEREPGRRDGRRAS